MRRAKAEGLGSTWKTRADYELLHLGAGEPRLASTPSWFYAAESWGVSHLDAVALLREVFFEEVLRFCVAGRGFGCCCMASSTKVHTFAMAFFVFSGRPSVFIAFSAFLWILSRVFPKRAYDRESALQSFFSRRPLVFFVSFEGMFFYRASEKS